MKKTVYALIAGAGLMVAGTMNASAETVVVENIPNGTEVTVVAGPQVDSLKKLVKKMDLTKEQKDKIRAIMTDADTKFDKGMKDAEANSKGLMALCGDKYDTDKVAKLADAQGKLVADAIKLRLSVRHQVWELLTPAQREDLKKFKEQHMEK